MSIGRIELIDGNKQFREYTGGNNAKSESEYVYIERFVKTETLLSEWNLTAYEYTTISAKMYDAITGEYLGKNIGGDYYIIKYVPLSFVVIPYVDILETIYPNNQRTIDSGFLSYCGVDVELIQGIFKFTNQKKLSENPLFTWYKLYAGTTGTSVNDFKRDYPAMLFPGYLKKLETDDPMYIKNGTKTLSDAENYIF